MGPARPADLYHAVAASVFGCLVHELNNGYMSQRCLSACMAMPGMQRR